MKVLVCGSRSIDESGVVVQAIYGSPFDVSTIVHGDAEGVDTHADQYAHDYAIDREIHPIPDWVWEKIGSKAGPMRNSYMIEDVDAVIAVWDGESSGTLDAIKQAESAGLPIYKVVCDETSDGWEIDHIEHIEDDQKALTDFES